MARRIPVVVSTNSSHRSHPLWRMCCCGLLLKLLPLVTMISRTRQEASFGAEAATLLWAGATTRRRQQRNYDSTSAPQLPLRVPRGGARRWTEEPPLPRRPSTDPASSRHQAAADEDPTKQQQQQQQQQHHLEALGRRTADDSTLDDANGAEEHESRVDSTTTKDASINNIWMSDEHEANLGMPEPVTETERADENSATTHPPGVQQPTKVNQDRHNNNHCPRITLKKTRRHASDILVDLVTRSFIEGGSILQNESQTLRHLIHQKTAEYLDDLRDTLVTSSSSAEQEQPADGSKKVPHPKRLLHLLAPKIPAIKHSPDVELCIQSTRSDMDSGVAACLLGTLGRVCELYERQQQQPPIGRGGRATAEDIVRDRRFEQLVECVVCGVDVKQKRHEWQVLQQHERDTHGSVIASGEDLEDIMQEAHFVDGLSIRDCCRAAWGIAVLGTNELKSIAGFPVADILVALALRSRELLLVRLQKLRRSDLYIGTGELFDLSIDDRLADFSEELAEDAASAIWTFACVKACTGMRFNPLFEVCFSILCTDPFELRRRAQEEEADIDTLSVGTNDVVDRLAQAESEDDADGLVETAFTETQKSQGSILIDWLSPKELTDIAWALAIHAGTKNSTSLTKAHESFNGIVFDRALRWVREELQFFGSPITDSLDMDLPLPVEAEVSNASSAPSLSDEESPIAVAADVDYLIGQDDDPAAPFASPSLGTESGHDKAKNEPGHLASADYVQVVDAAALLASESVAAASPACYNTGNTMDERRVVEGREVLSAATDASGEELLETLFSILTPHDLCSVAWSVTELDDCLRSNITSSVTEIFVQAGPDALSGLSGGDLSNIAWALARMPTSSEVLTGSEELATLLIGWITDEALLSAAGSAENILQRFHPPELSRLLWAVAEIYTTRLGGTRMAGTDVSDLVSIGLLAAASNLHVFGTEDLARIVWAFLSLSDGFFDSEQKVSVLESLALGKILASIEICLHNWENCKHSSTEGSGSDAPRRKEATRFASFLGKSRRHIPFLDQRVDDSDELDLPLHADRSSLPLLRDLPIDPLTLCKIACRLERLADSQDGARVTETLTRVALRLLTSRKGRLLQECPINDLVRMCEAAARTHSASTRELVSHFSRLLVQHLNGPGQEDICTLSPGHHAMFLWALGELGVKYTPAAAEDAASAHRRLHLVSSIPFLESSQMVMLSHSRAAKMLRGLITMRVAFVDKRPLLEFLKVLANRIAFIQDETVMCDMMKSLGFLVMTMEAVKDTAEGLSSPADPVDPTTTTTTVTDSNLSSSEATVLDADVVDLCSKLLNRFAARAVEKISCLKAKSLRAILMLVSLLPFQADECVDAIDIEVVKRIRLLEDSQHKNIDELLGSIALEASNTKRILFGDAQPRESRSPFIGLKNGLKAIFGSSATPDINDGGNEIDEAIVGSSEISIADLAGSLKHSLQLIEDAALAIRNATEASQTSLGRMIASPQQESLFELGRCTELIEQYRRIDFASGSRRSRLDEERRRDMAKRLLSRKLP